MKRLVALLAFLPVLALADDAKPQPPQVCLSPEQAQVVTFVFTKTPSLPLPMETTFPVVAAVQGQLQQLQAKATPAPVEPKK